MSFYKNQKYIPEFNFDTEGWVIHTVKKKAKPINTHKHKHKYDYDWLNDYVPNIIIIKKIKVIKQPIIINNINKRKKRNNAEKRNAYYMKNRDRLLEKGHKYYAENKEKVRKRYEANRERIAARESERVTCNICRCQVTRGSMRTHVKLMKHINNINAVTVPKEKMKCGICNCDITKAHKARHERTAKCMKHANDKN